MTECPHCGQTIRMWSGVKLEPQKAAILDMIGRATRDRGGISRAALCGVLYPGVDELKQTQRLRVQVCTINDMLAATNWRIVSTWAGNRHNSALYQLIETKSEAA